MAKKLKKVAGYTFSPEDFKRFVDKLPAKQKDDLRRVLKPLDRPDVEDLKKLGPGKDHILYGEEDFLAW